jgi:hypothetical protein
MKERTFQSKLIKDIKAKFPGCEILKNDSSYLQGVPDLLILYNNRWAMLECKKSNNSFKQPNQEYYIKRFNEMSFSAFISPDNFKEVLNAMEQVFQS